MGYPFGQDFTYKVYPLIDGNLVTTIPNQTAVLYIYDAKPTRANAVTGAGAIAGPINATWTANATSCSFTVPALDDPDPTAQEESVMYWISCRLILTAAEQYQYIIRYLDMERVSAHDKTVDVVYTDLAVLSPGVTSYAGTSEQTAQITAATALVKARLMNRGYQWAQLSRADRLNDTVKFLALSNIYQSKMQRPGDQFDKLYEDYKKTSEELLQSLKLEFDAEGEGEVEEEVLTGSFGRIIR